MKEASGELNMTVITIIAIGAVLAFFWIMWPNIKKQIEGAWNKATTDKETGESGYNFTSMIVQNYEFIINK